MTVAALQLKPKDVTAPLRARRYRQKKNRKETNANVTVRPDLGVTVSTPEMGALAARLSDGRATIADLRLAERIIMTFVDKLPPDSTIYVR
jgi:hypothetical protein